MHATRDTNDVINLQLAGGRVMRGVRLLRVGWQQTYGIAEKIGDSFKCRVFDEALSIFSHVGRNHVS